MTVAKMEEITKHQLSLLHHTLGLRPDRREPFRNHFVAGPGHHDQPDLEKLESAGMMKRAYTPSFLRAGDVVFCVTDAGKAYAIEHLEPLPPTPKLSKYREYLDADTGHSFAEFMGINKPVEECNHAYGENRRYRYVRYARRYAWDCHIDVAGPWMPTKKEAKAGYKAALNSYRERAKETVA